MIEDIGRIGGLITQPKRLDLAFRSIFENLRSKRNEMRSGMKKQEKKLIEYNKFNYNKFNAETYNPLERQSTFLDPQLLAWSMRHGLDNPIVNYIYWSIVAKTKKGGIFYMSRTRIASTLGVSLQSVKRAVANTKLFYRSGKVGQQAALRPWLLTDAELPEVKAPIAACADQLSKGQSETATIAQYTEYYDTTENPMEYDDWIKTI